VVNRIKIESMKILAFEYATASGACGDTFLEEGKLMLVSLLAELAAAGLGVVTTLANRSFDQDGITADETVVIEGSFFAAVERQMENADVVWIIAPESKGILYRLTEMAERLGKKVIGSSPDALKLCGDKLSLARFLSGKISMPPSELFAGNATQTGVRSLRGTPVPPPYNSDFPCVVKPLDGAGSENIYFVNDKKRLRQIEIDDGNYLIQPYVEGESLSAGIVSGGGAPMLLGVCRQEIELSERLKFKNVAGPIDYPNRDGLIGMIEKINRLIPALGGYWGIDFIDCDGHLTLIEINPRLTTSYPIYAKACGFNIAERAHSGMAQTWLA
jgi:predicted ATP-grasp superfamily ATP-dependent carboligase